VCEPGCVDEREWILELLYRGHTHEQEHNLGPARRLLTQALDAASAADMPEVVRTNRTLLGIVAHKADRLDEAPRTPRRGAPSRAGRRRPHRRGVLSPRARVSPARHG
jgi:hypothetical protein